MKTTRLAVCAVLCVAVLPLAACGSSGSKAESADAKQTLTVFTDSDVNVQKLWTGTLIPAYQKAHPNITLKFSSADASADTTQLAKLSAAVKAGRTPPMDVIVDAGFLPDADSAGLLTPVNTGNIPNLGAVDKASIQGKGQMPYRGSSVVIAYDSKKVRPAPKTLADVIAWSKAHKGGFTYNSPSSGGAGQGFVQAVLDSKLDQADTVALTKAADPAVEKKWAPGFAELKSLTPSIYQKTYPNSNQAALNLLANGTIAMTPTWSDMFLSNSANGTLGKNIKAVSVSNPELPGGNSSLAVVKNSSHQKAALQLLNWILEPAQQSTIATTLSGYPAIPLSKLPESDQSKFNGLNTSKLRLFYTAAAVTDMTAEWQKQVP
ncbi:extracellular solute-binding protein [Flexivirga meconopsidis]|uniref:extracellular solute-binding protein n=1 Tax=Flexivirga meconopsidis TaxID=2977121 RepID=UPI00223ECC2E|nr:extracellular solute-binding protein [Flexivirga meconopsidis]